MSACVCLTSRTFVSLNTQIHQYIYTHTYTHLLHTQPLRKQATRQTDRLAVAYKCLPYILVKCLLYIIFIYTKTFIYFVCT